MDLGDRMKMYEGTEAQRRLMPLLPAIARLDGRAFHSFTRGFARPYDERMTHLMQDLAVALVEECNARIGYTQSDEITLVMHSDSMESQLYFDGRIQKMTSSLAAFASVWFCEHLDDYFHVPLLRTSFATFDCRVWNVPSLEEATNCLLWREWDATKNSIAMAAQAKFSQADLHGKNGKQMQEMLFQEHGINWNDYADEFKRGSYYRRVTTSAPFTVAELELLPPKHAARTNHDLVVERSKVERLVMPPITSVLNRVGVIFYGEEPLTVNGEALATT